MANLIDKLTAKVDSIRQKAADRFGLPAFDLYHIVRTWDGGEVGAGNSTTVETKLYPTPMIKIVKGQDELIGPGRESMRTMKASEVSLTYTEDFLVGRPLAPGKECYYRLVERNGQGAETTCWVLDGLPQAHRDEINWELSFVHYHSPGE